MLWLSKVLQPRPDSLSEDGRTWSVCVSMIMQANHEVFCLLEPLATSQFESAARDFILGGFSALCANHKSSPYANIVCFRLSSPALINTELIPFVLALANAQTLQMVFFSPEHSGSALDSHTDIYTKNASG